jgi:glutathione S-transferase
MAPPSLGALLARPASELSRSGEHGQKYLLGGYSVAEAYQLTVRSWSKFAKVASSHFPMCGPGRTVSPPGPPFSKPCAGTCEETIMPKFTLISFKLCPYVQRVAIALQEKHIAYDLVYIDLADKPDWFNAISPLGKVPLLKVEQGGEATVLFESSVILEYLEDLGSATLCTRSNQQPKPNVAPGWNSAQSCSVTSGLFFAGTQFSYVDAVFAPAFRYFEVLDRYTGKSLLEGFPKVLSWRAELAKRDSIRGALTQDYHVLPDQFLRSKSWWPLANALELDGVRTP